MFSGSMFTFAPGVAARLPEARARAVAPDVSAETSGAARLRSWGRESAMTKLQLVFDFPLLFGGARNRTRYR